jgi:hypothetical protein
MKLKKINKKPKSTKLTRQTSDLCHEREITQYKKQI